MRIWITLGTLAAVALVALGQRRRAATEGLPLAATEAEKRILSVLEDAVRKHKTHLNVPTIDGRMLRLLAETTGAKSVVEIGTSTGLSGLWFSMALQKTGGRLTTFEIDPGRAAIARGNFKEAGVDGLVTIVEGDAHKNVTSVKGPLDIVFLDADKEGYIDYLEKLLPQVRPGGLILAHNVDMIADYLAKVNADPALETVLFMEGNGLAITLKKR